MLVRGVSTTVPFMQFPIVFMDGDGRGRGDDRDDGRGDSDGHVRDVSDLRSSLQCLERRIVFFSHCN